MNDRALIELGLALRFGLQSIAEALPWTGFWIGLGIAVAGMAIG